MKSHRKTTSCEDKNKHLMGRLLSIKSEMKTSHEEDKNKNLMGRVLSMEDKNWNLIEKLFFMKIKIKPSWEGYFLWTQE